MHVYTTYIPIYIMFPEIHMTCEVLKISLEEIKIHLIYVKYLFAYIHIYTNIYYIPRDKYGMESTKMSPWDKIGYILCVSIIYLHMYTQIYNN